MATHVRRTQLLREGRTPTEVTGELSGRLGVTAHLLPMSDDRVRTQLRTPAGWLDFQDYFVRRGQRDEVLEVRREGIEAARPTAAVLSAVAAARLIVIAPSNPFVSVGTILAVPGMLAALSSADAPVIAVSPVVAGRALRGPADRMLVSLGGEASAAGVVAHYRDLYPGLVDVFVLDEADAEAAERLRAAGVAVDVMGTVMRSHEERRQLAQALLSRYLPV
jgi:LPPG:FO 2-phospho-L-lactate transferase